MAEVQRRCSTRKARTRPLSAIDRLGSGEQTDPDQMTWRPVSRSNRPGGRKASTKERPSAGSRRSLRPTWSATAASWARMRLERWRGDESTAAKSSIRKSRAPGPIVKTTGDGLLIEFPAWSRQSPVPLGSRGMAERNAPFPNGRIDFAPH